jgi:6-phosphogluconolactonase
VVDARFVVTGASGVLNRLDVEADRLVFAGEYTCGPDVAALALGRDENQLYASVRSGPSVVTFDLAADGTPALVAETPVPSPLVALGVANGVLVGVSYPDGVAITLPLDDAGRPRPDAGRVTGVGDHPHCVVPDGQNVWIALLGADRLLLVPVTADGLAIEAAHRVELPAAFGPRHLARAADGTVFVVGELCGRVARIPPGATSPDAVWSVVSSEHDLAPGVVRSVTGPNPERDATGRPLVWAADLVLAPDGRTLWTSERRTSQLATSSTDGRLVRSIGTEAQPRGIALDAAGRYLLVSGERSTTVTLYRTEAGGSLHEVDRAPVPPGAIWVQALPV